MITYVNGICLSACSQFVIVAAENLYFREDTIVGFHDSQTSTNILVGQENIRPGMRSNADEEADYYYDLGINISLLTLPTEQLGIKCVIDFEQYSRTGGLRLKMDYDYYMPDQDYFSQVYPGSLKTAWPDLEKVESKLSSKGLRAMRFKLGKTIQNPLANLSAC